MKAPMQFGIAIATLFFPQILLAQNDADQEFWQWLITRSRELEVEELPKANAISVLLDIAESSFTIGRKEVAGEFLARASAILDIDVQDRYQRQLFNTAIEINRLEVAEKLALDAGRSSDSMLDRLDVERLKRGNRTAVKDYPRQQQDFHNALQLAQAYVDIGDYKAAEEYVTDIVISEENDPRAVTAITLRNIANRCRDDNDLKSAKRYIDKAMAVGGRLYYTGYSIQVTHRSIHGKLNKGLDKFAQLGANYRGHQGRELIQVLIGELSRAGHFKEAKRTTRFLEKPGDVDRSLKRIATQQATNGEIEAAHETVKVIKDGFVQNLARICIAKSVWNSGKHGAAKERVASVANKLKDDPKINAQLVHIFGLMRRQDKVSELVDDAQVLSEKANLIRLAIQGFAESATASNSNN